MRVIEQPSISTTTDAGLTIKHQMPVKIPKEAVLKSRGNIAAAWQAESMIDSHPVDPRRYIREFDVAAYVVFVWTTPNHCTEYRLTGGDSSEAISWARGKAGPFVYDVAAELEDEGQPQLAFILRGAQNVP